MAALIGAWPYGATAQVTSERRPSNRQEDDSNIRLVPPVPDELSDDDTVTVNDDYARRIEALEARVAELVADNASGNTIAGIESRVENLRQSLLGLRENEQRFLNELSSESDRILNGRIHLDLWDFPHSSPGINILETGDPTIDPDNRIEFRRVRFGMRGNIPPENMSYRVEIEFGGDDGGRVRDAWLGWDDLALFQTIRIGNQKRPYGLDHLNSSNFNVFLERPMIIDSFNENARRFGVLSYGVLRDNTVNWRFGVFDLRQIQDAGSIRSDRLQPEVAWRLSSLLLDGCAGSRYWHVGVAGTVAYPNGFAFNGRRDDNQARFRSFPEGRSEERWLNTGRIMGAQTYEIAAFESVLNFGPLQIGGEYLNLWLQRDDFFGQSLDLHGGYVYVSYFVTGEHIPWNRQLGTIGRVEPIVDFYHARQIRGSGAWQVAFRYSRADLNDHDVLGGIGTSLTAAVNWYWNAHSRLQFNYVWGNIDDRLATNGPSTGVVVSGDYAISGVRFMIDF